MMFPAERQQCRGGAVVGKVHDAVHIRLGALKIRGAGQGAAFPAHEIHPGDGLGCAAALGAELCHLLPHMAAQAADENPHIRIPLFFR